MWLPHPITRPYGESYGRPSFYLLKYIRGPILESHLQFHLKQKQSKLNKRWFIPSLFLHPFLPAWRLSATTTCRTSSACGKLAMVRKVAETGETRRAAKNSSSPALGWFRREREVAHQQREHAPRSMGRMGSV